MAYPIPYIIKDNDLFLDNEEKKYILRVRDLPVEEKPRERLVRYGPEVLSVSELLAIVVSVGTKKEGVLEMTSRILQEYGEKGIMSERNPKRIVTELDVPFTKACQIVACFELGRRFFQKIPNGQAMVRTAKQAYEYLKDMRELPREQLRGIYLNSHYRVVHYEVISIGSMTSNIVHPREVFKPAIEYCAVAVIVAHNHPSGSVKPSRADIEITKQLANAGVILGIDFLDHLIITKHKFISVPHT